MSGKIIHISTQEEFNTYIKQEKVTVVDFYADWCGPCKRISPFVAKMAERYPEVNFIKVDVDSLTDVAMDQQIRAMPTFKVFQAGNEKQSFMGADEQMLEKTIQQHAS